MVKTAEARLPILDETPQGATFPGTTHKKEGWSRRILFSSWSRRGLLLLITLAILLTFSARVEDLDRTLRDNLLKGLGYGLAPVALWSVGLLLMLRRSPLLLFRWWRFWLGSGLLLGAILGSLAFFNAYDGLLEEASLGGNLGSSIRGDAVAWGVLRVAVLAALGFWILAPRMTRQVVRWLLLSILAVVAGLRTGWETTMQRMASLRHRLSTSQGVHSARAYLARVLRRSSPTSQVEAPVPPPLQSEYHFSEPEPVAPEPISPEAGSNPLQSSLEDIFSPEETVTTPLPRQLASTGLGWSPPPLTLLEKGSDIQVMESENQEVARQIEGALNQYGVEVTVKQIKPGPTVTMFGLVPGWVRRYRQVRQRDEEGNVLRNSHGTPITTREEEKTRVKVDSILAREKDLALALATPSLRIEAPVPGESVVGVEVPNKQSTLVTIRSVMESEPFIKLLKRGGLVLALGQGSGGEAVAVNLVHMPHLLIAGATGSGKSVCLNGIISSLITHMSPGDLRLLLVDPKRVELTPYNGIPHLLTPVMVDPEQVIRVLKGLIQEMFHRYRRMERVGVRNIQAYNRQMEEHMPYLVVCVDELANLMMAAPYDVERAICRLAQLGRATGIHLILATQRPSVDVVTGLIKANFPSRLSFAVASQVDSRTVLDISGAEKLLGHGDMLFLAPDAPKPKRIQGTFISDGEIEALVEYWRNQSGPLPPDIPLETRVHEAEEQERTEAGDTPHDELLDKAIEMASRHKTISTSLLQRRLRIGYPRAARLMDQLEEEGVVGSGEAGKSREVLRRNMPPEE